MARASLGLVRSSWPYGTFMGVSLNIMFGPAAVRQPKLSWAEGRILREALLSEPDGETITALLLDQTHLLHIGGFVTLIGRSEGTTRPPPAGVSSRHCWAVK